MNLPTIEKSCLIWQFIVKSTEYNLYYNCLYGNELQLHSGTLVAFKDTVELLKEMSCSKRDSALLSITNNESIKENRCRYVC